LKVKHNAQIESYSAHNSPKVGNGEGYLVGLDVIGLFVGEGEG
jgi:hypothetical protein